MHDMYSYSHQIETLLAPPFEWCYINGGSVVLTDAVDRGGTRGGVFAIGDFAISKYLITNAQFEPFVQHSTGYINLSWWGYSAQAIQWRQTRKKAHQTAFSGTKVPRTRVGWFESMAFCAWLSHSFANSSRFSIKTVTTWPIRLPSEQEWQRAALGDTSGPSPWGNAPVDETRANCANWAGQPTMDVWGQNILVDGRGNITGLVDFDRALWGDVEIEFAVLDYCGISKPAFWEGYGQPRDESASAEIRRLFYLLYEVQKYMPIHIWRRNDPTGAARYKQHSLALAAQMGLG